MSSEPTTIFRETVRGLASSLAEAAVDHRAFEMPLPICALTKCRATCCHDGVILTPEEAEVLGREGKGVVELEDGRFKTETVAASSDQLAEDFPGHFPETRCVFLDDQHRCRLATSRGGGGKASLVLQTNVLLDASADFKK